MASLFRLDIVSPLFRFYGNTFCQQLIKCVHFVICQVLVSSLDAGFCPTSWWHFSHNVFPSKVSRTSTAFVVWVGQAFKIHPLDSRRSNIRVSAPGVYRQRFLQFHRLQTPFTINAAKLFLKLRSGDIERRKMIVSRVLMLVNHMDKAPQRNDFVKQIVGAFHYDCQASIFNHGRYYCSGNHKST